jgi:hypothetical protein
MYNVPQTKLTFHTTYITLKQKGLEMEVPISAIFLEVYTYRCVKHPTVFEIQKPTCQLSAAFVLTIIMYSDVWSLVEVECWSVQQ